MCEGEKPRSVSASHNTVRAVSALSVYAFLCFAPAAQASVDYVTYTGIARAPQGEQALYREHHVVQYQNGQLTDRVVLYQCTTGESFARKEVHYSDLLAPDFRLEDQSNGVVEGVSQAGGRRWVFFKDGFAGTETRAPVPAVGGLVADAGFDEFIRSHWQSLVSGRSEPIRFLVPSLLKEMSFTVRHQGEAVIQGVPAEVFRLNLAGVLGWFLSGIDVYYSKERRVLLRYQGLSNLRDNHGRNFATAINFPVDRDKPATEADMRAALSVPLTACPKGVAHTSSPAT
jgi:hypothetical protein